jgi:hypothetical protein
MWFLRALNAFEKAWTWTATSDQYSAGKTVTQISSQNRLAVHWNREPLELAKKAGVKVNRPRRSFFGIFHRIEAEPARTITVPT